MWNNSNPPSLNAFSVLAVVRNTAIISIPPPCNHAFKGVVHKSDIYKRVTAHTFRHSFATHLLKNSGDVHTLQGLLGHKGLRATMIYIPVPKTAACLYAAL